MHTINIYFDEKLSTRDVVKLKREIEKMPYIIDVEHPRHDIHNLTIEYEKHPDMPELLLKELRSRGFHPDVTSA